MSKNFCFPKNTSNEYQNIFETALKLADINEVNSLTKEDIRLVYGSSKLNTFQTRPSVFHALIGRRVYLIVKSKNSEVDSLWKSLPENAQVVILVHEFCHILDYRKMSNLEMAAFSVKYLLSKSFRKITEYRVDSLAVQKSAEYNDGWKQAEPKNHTNSFSKKYWENVRDLYVRHEDSNKQ